MSHNQYPLTKHSQTYSPPKITHRGALKQFAGSPLGKDKGIGLPGLPWE